jgi:hypothetical protein
LHKVKKSGKPYRTPVEDPRIVPMHEVAHYFDTGDRAGFRLLAIHEALRMRTAEQ